LTRDALEPLLTSYKNGETDIDAVLKAVKTPTFEELGYAKIDHDRTRRQGFPEVIFCQGKTPEQIEKIAARILQAGGAGLIATRADQAAADAVLRAAPDARYDSLARIVTVTRKKISAPPLPICVMSAGTSDMPVAEEAAITAETLGNRVERVYDVGVAGIHRLFNRLDLINEAGVIICVAGMEGALASVVGGLSDAPVIAVPTSVGYGASFGGVAALLSMLNSCAAGVGVMNIDNGFGAAMLANRMVRRMTRGK